MINTLAVVLLALTTGVGEDPVIDPGHEAVRVEHVEAIHPSYLTAGRPKTSVTTNAATEPNPLYHVCDLSYPGQFWCSNFPPSPATPGRTATPAAPVSQSQLHKAVEVVGLPKGSVTLQPAGGYTLVNLPTVMSTQAKTIDTTVTVLGTPVRIHATPSSYLWLHGDGTSQRTSTPGAAWPSTQVTHTYLRTSAGVNVSVNISYNVTYRVGSGAWQQLAEPITTVGPATQIAVREAQPILSNP